MHEIDTRPIMVSICSITYNHAPYIRQCLDGFLMQKCNFRYEIIINDDCSTDGTTEIIREYEREYSDIIHPIYQSENQYQKGVRGMFAKFVFPKAKGKYIAVCEGDDYWTDPLKLQKQVNFLEMHTDYSMCFTNAIVHYQNKKIKDYPFVDGFEMDCDFTGIELYSNWLVPTCTMAFRNKVVHSIYMRKVQEDERFIYGDIVLVLASCALGKVYGFCDLTGVYRRNEGSLVYSCNSETMLKEANQADAIVDVFGDYYQNASIKVVVDKCVRAFYKSFVTGEKMIRWNILRKSVQKSWMHTFIRLLCFPFEYVVKTVRR